jgi:H+/Cl- antiporter ClcA
MSEQIECWRCKGAGKITPRKHKKAAKTIIYSVVGAYVAWVAYSMVTDPSSFFVNKPQSFPAWYLLLIAFLVGMLFSAVAILVFWKLMRRSKAKSDAETAVALSP